MTELDTAIRAGLQALAEQPGPGAPPLEEVLHRGRRARRTRRAVRAGALVAALVLVAGSAVGLTGHHATSSPRVQAGTPAPADGDEPLTWTYWRSASDQVGYVMRDGAPAQVPLPSVSAYYGRDRAGVLQQGADVAPLAPVSDHATGAAGGSAAYWQQVWDAPRDVTALRIWVKEHRAPADNAIADWLQVQQMLSEPAPASLRKALVALLAARPGATVSHGTDLRGRPALVTSLLPAADHPQGFSTYTDPTTAELLETAVFVGPPREANALPAGHLESASVVTAYGPVTSAPAVTPKRVDTVPPNTAGTPTCTPGTADDASDPVAVALARLCLPDPAAGFPRRVEPDHYGDGIARAFVVEDAAGHQVRVQVAARDQYFLSLASSPVPVHGKVGMDRYVGAATALGRPAAEVEDGSGARGLVLEKDGFGVEAFGSGVTHAQLVALVDQLHGFR